MEAKQKRVFIVEGGTFGPQHYASYIDILKRVLEDVKTRPLYETEEPKQVATVEVVSSPEEAEARVARDKVDIVIFVSADMDYAARKLRRRFKDLTVYVLAGKAVDGEPFIVPKRVLTHEGIGLILQGA